ncbi:MAG TPA: rhomboid family intramembrane serine protease [Polyangia bacterium]|nr:rhomboid family intramembrane serine protease [Polyangia bacterium]
MLIPLRDRIPRARFPIVTLFIVVANVLVFLYELSLDPRGQQYLVLAAGAIPYEIVHHVDLRPPDLFPLPGSIWTSMFLHGGWMHLIGNMWFLWLFGDNVEDALGSLRYLIFYFVVGTVGALAQIFAMPDSTAPMIGASGAVAGALGAYVMLYPHARIVSLIPIPLLWPVIDVRAWVFLGLWFLGQFFLPTGSGVAWMAHVGGFIAGAGLVRLLAPRRPPPPVDVEYIPPPRR